MIIDVPAPTDHTVVLVLLAKHNDGALVVPAIVTKEFLDLADPAAVGPTIFDNLKRGLEIARGLNPKKVERPA